MSNLQTIMDQIFEKYEKPCYYCIETKSLSFDKPDSLYLELYEPPFIKKVCGIEIGSLVTTSKDEFRGQVTMIWPSINRIELHTGKFQRGTPHGSDLSIISELIILKTGYDIKRFYELEL